MKRRQATLALAAAGLLPAAPAAWAQGGPPVEGKQFARLPQPLPTTPGKIDVVEFFFYRCPHCYAFDPALSAWVHQLPADVSFRRVPVGAPLVLKLHQRMYYALESMGALTPAVHAGIFNAFHRGGVEANDEAAIVTLMGQLGVDTARFKSAFHAFSMDAKLSQGAHLVEAAGVEGVPALVIAGRWRTSPSQAGAASQDEVAQGRQALVVADFLIKQARSGKSS